MANEGTLTGKTDDGTTWTYTGSILNGVKHGKGKVVWSDGDIYEGDWVNGNEHGKGKMVWANGDIYEGDWVDGNPTGKGKSIYVSGKIYEGDFVEGNPVGKGKLTTADGDVFEGNFVDGNPTKGKITQANGEVYEGDFDDIISQSVKVKREKKELKILLICSAIGFILGTIIGANGGGTVEIILGMWFGIGVGGALTLLDILPYTYKETLHERGFEEAIKEFFKTLIFLLIAFTLAGPIGFLVRVIRKNIIIKKLQRN